jgi:hypothetical protein
MLAQLEKTLNVPLVWLVPRMSLVGENINSRRLTNHLEDPRSILATLVGGHRTHNDFLPNEVENAKVLLRIGTTTSTRILRASSPFSLPLSERNVIFIESFANHLLAGTTHLEMLPARIDKLPARIGCSGGWRIVRSG